MSQFLYHIAGQDKPLLQKRLDAHGLGDILGPETPDNPIAQRQYSPGPDGKTGLLLTRGSDATRFDAEAQEWLVRGSIGVGMIRNDPPAPGDLVRDDLLPGETKALGDGNDWVVPVALRFPGIPGLPRKLSLVGGKWQAGDVVQRYAALWDMAWQVFTAYIEAPQHDNRIVIDNAPQIAAELLRANYRIREEEASLLGLFTTENLWRQIFDVVVDWQTFIDRQGELADLKKKLDDSQPDDELRATCGSEDS